MRPARDLQQLIDWATKVGLAVIDSMLKAIVARIKRNGPTGRFLTAAEREQLGIALYRIMLAADLTARMLQWDRIVHKYAEAYVRHGDEIIRLKRKLVTSSKAIEIFKSKAPGSGVDLVMLRKAHATQAFKLAKTMDAVLTEHVYGFLKKAVATGAEPYSLKRFQEKFTEDLLGEDVSRRAKAYTEMVFRTNLNATYQRVAYEEGASPEMEDYFPGWEYLGILDGREGEDHRPNFGKVFPRETSFEEVRGDRVFNCRCSLRWLTKDEYHAAS